MLQFRYMVHRHHFKSLTWYDILNPTNDEIRELMAECGIPPGLARDLTSMTPRSDVEFEKGIVKLTIDYPVVRRTDIQHPHEIKFIATKTALITIRFEEIETLHSFSKEFEVLGVLNNGTKAVSGPALLVAVLTYLYGGLDRKLDYLESKLNDVEKEIFNEHEKEMVTEISQLGRRIITFRHVVSTHEHVIESLPDALETAFTKKTRDYIDGLPASFDHVHKRVQAIQRTLDELRDTNAALLTTKQNEIMKIFTILAFITFPLTLFTSMFGMNTISTPIVNQPGDFWIISGIMVGVSFVFFIYFRYKKWL